MWRRVVTDSTTWRSSGVPPEVREYVYARDGYVCQYCGASGDGVALEPDHVIPARLRGPDAVANLVTACRPCNRNKGGHTVTCWKAGKPCRLTIPFPRYSKTACTLEEV